MKAVRNGNLLVEGAVLDDSFDHYAYGHLSPRPPRPSRPPRSSAGIERVAYGLPASAGCPPI